MNEPASRYRAIQEFRIRRVVEIRLRVNLERVRVPARTYDELVQLVRILTISRIYTHSKESWRAGELERLLKNTRWSQGANINKIINLFTYSILKKKKL